MRRLALVAALDASLLVTRHGGCSFKSFTKGIFTNQNRRATFSLSHHRHHLPVSRARCYGTGSTPANSSQESEEEDFYEEDFSSDDLVDEEEEEDSEDSDEFEDDEFEEDEDEEREVEAGDGEDGGGVVLGGSQWGAKALELARTLLPSGSDLALYGFKVSGRGFVQVRLDKLTDKFGSPTIQEVESFNVEYSTLLENAGRSGLVPENLSVEVSSPGAERVLQIPSDFTRFKEQPMQVFYYPESESEASTMQNRILELETYDQESLTSVWKLANVRANREVLGKGKSFNRKQREWRLELPLTSIKMVRLHVDV